MFQRGCEMTQYAGRWGKCLSSMLAFSWGLSVALGSQYATDTPPLGCLTLALGSTFTATLIFAIAAFPSVAVALDSVALRFVSTTALLTLWAFFVIDMSVHWQVYRPALGTAIVGFIGAANADWQLLRRLRGEAGEP